MDKSLALKPRMSEKTYGLSQERNVYTFIVPMGTSKPQVAKAVAAQFGVGVVSTNMVTSKGKAKRTVRKRGRVSQGTQGTTKKAYVRLKAGDSLPIFAAVEEAEAETAKAADKIAKKDKK